MDEIYKSQPPADDRGAFLTPLGTRERASVLSDAHGHHENIIAEALRVDVTSGLCDQEAAARLERDGPNRLTSNEGPHWWVVLLRQFSSLVIWLLVTAAVISWFTNGPIEATAIAIVLVLNAVIGFLVEWRAGKAVIALRREESPIARVLRNGRERIVDAGTLTVGDIIKITAGDRVPADARVVEAVSLRTDESVLTGESTTVEKCNEAVSFSSILAERRSMLYLGTVVSSGRGTAIVTAVGPFTELGRIAQLLARTRSERTPLESRMESLGRRLVYLVLGFALVVLLAGLLRDDPIWLMIEIAISLAVAAVPEALPAMTTLILALGVLAMARSRAIVRRLSAVEALGSTTVICTDKTGTLTENRMTVREYFLADGQHIATPFTPALQKPLGRLSRVSVVCNDAVLAPSDPTNAGIGDPTEIALLTSARDLGIEIVEYRRSFTKIFEEPFDAVTRRMLTVVRTEPGGRLFALVKGSPAAILNSSSHFVGEDGSHTQLNDDLRKHFLEVNEAMASKALRVLAFAEKELISASAPGIEHELTDGFVFLGFAGMSDPLKEGVFTAVREARQAGIRVVMLTGDQVNTARAIAGELQLGDDDIRVVHSKDLAAVMNGSAKEPIERTHVFARVSPDDKLQIVEAFQRAGEIVAVTGDGINDAPALRRANIGIAMGLRGTEVAKEAADVVLTDDNFATIVKAIEGGRTIYANIVKFVHFMFSSNLAEVLVIFFSILTGLALPLSPLQILWVNLITDVFPAFALALEPAVEGTMRRGPRPPGEALLSRSFLVLIGWQGSMLAVITLLAYRWALEAYGPGSHARTIALFALIAVQTGQLFNCRSQTRSAFKGFFTNRFIFAAVAFVVLVQIAAYFISPLSQVLDLARLTAVDVALVFACAAVPILITEITKLPARRNAVKAF